MGQPHICKIAPASVLKFHNPAFRHFSCKIQYPRTLEPHNCTVAYRLADVTVIIMGYKLLKALVKIVSIKPLFLPIKDSGYTAKNIVVYSSIKYIRKITDRLCTEQMDDIFQLKPAFLF